MTFDEWFHTVGVKVGPVWACATKDTARAAWDAAAKAEREWFAADTLPTDGRTVLVVFDRSKTEDAGYDFDRIECYDGPVSVVAWDDKLNSTAYGHRLPREGVKCWTPAPIPSEDKPS